METARKSAIVAGVALIVMALAAGFSFGFVHNSLVIPGNPAATVNNLKASEALFQMEVLGWIIILLCDIAVAIALYYFFKNENHKLSMYTASARLFYSAILGVAISCLVLVIIRLNNSEVDSKKIISQLESFRAYWSFGLIIFGIHLFLLGLLVIQSNFIHNFWGILLIFAGISYSLIHSSYFLFSEFESQIKTVETILSAPMAFAEIGFGIWLIARGGKPKIIFKTIGS